MWLIFVAHIISIFISYCSYNKLSQMQWLTTKQICQFSVLSSEVLKPRGKQGSKKYFVSLPFPAFKGLSHFLACGPCLHLLSQQHSIFFFFLAFTLLFSPRNLTYRTKYQMKNSHQNKNKDRSLKNKMHPQLHHHDLTIFSAT